MSELLNNKPSHLYLLITSSPFSKPRVLIKYGVQTSVINASHLPTCCSSPCWIWVVIKSQWVHGAGGLASIWSSGLRLPQPDWFTGCHENMPLRPCRQSDIRRWFVGLIRNVQVKMSQVKLSWLSRVMLGFLLRFSTCNILSISHHSISSFPHIHWHWHSRSAECSLYG